MTEKNITDCRTCFGTDAGKRVLGWMLAYGGYFDDDIETTEQMAVVNFLKHILKNLGIYDKDSIDSYVQNLLSIPPNFGKEQNGKDS